MKPHWIALAAALSAAELFAQAPPATRPATSPATMVAIRPATRPATGPALTPAEALIRGANQAAAAHPESAGPVNVLAFAYARRARETGDAAWYAKVDEAVKRSEKLAPGNADAAKVRALVLIARDRPAEALQLIAPVLKKAPDDLMARGLASDAHLALGDYDAAETEAQYILDTRPNNPVGLICGANLRVMYGDIDGAIELLGDAIARTPPNDQEERARLLAKAARLHLMAGRINVAAAAAAAAQGEFPDYYDAMDAGADVLAAEGKPADALALRRRVEQMVPRPVYQHALALSLERAGKAKEAADAFAAFARQARAAEGGPLEANRLLVLDDVDRAGDPAAAMLLTEKMLASRHDVFTLDAAAWATNAAGKPAEARQLIDRALAVGVRDATLFTHAAAIAADQGDRAAARQFLRQAEDLTPAPLVTDRMKSLEQRIEQLPATAPATAPATLPATRPAE